MNAFTVVLCGARHSGNVGLVARAMKNTGLSNLLLVRGVNHRNKTVQMFGAPAKDVLDAARTSDNLSAALKPYSYVVGFTRREGKMRLRLMPFLDLVSTLHARAKKGKVALLFGNERTGLSTEELSHCDTAAYLPSNPDFPSMNLSHAVMLVGYELLKAGAVKGSLGGVRPSTEEKLPTQDELETMFGEVTDILRRLTYADTPKIKLLTSIQRNLRRMTKRAMPSCGELNMLRGILARLKQRLPLSS